MTTTTDTPVQTPAAAVQRERTRCIGLVLAAVGRARLAHQDELVHVLEALATRMEFVPEERWHG